MKKLYLHIGQHKTGSSFIQSLIAKNHALIENNAIKYPYPERFLSIVAKGYIGNGNGYLLSEENRPELLKTIKSNYNDESLLFSWENLYAQLVLPEYIATIELLKKEFSIEEVSILLFIRDPIEHACSYYQQLVKRSGMTMSVEDYFLRYNTPIPVARLLNTYANKRDLKINTFNYTANSSSILNIFLDWLGISDQEIDLPAITTVNRSLTYGELELVRFLNKFSAKRGQLIADKLCHSLPDIKADVVCPSEAVQQAMLDRLRGAINNVQQRTHPDQNYSLELLPESNPDNTAFQFSKEQLQVISEALGKEFRRLDSLCENLE